MPSLWQLSVLIATFTHPCTFFLLCFPLQRPRTHWSLYSDVLQPCKPEPTHLLGWLCHPDVLFYHFGHQQVLSTHSNGIWPLCGHLQPLEVHSHHEQEGMCPAGMGALQHWATCGHNSHFLCVQAALLWQRDGPLFLLHPPSYETLLCWHHYTWHN